MLSKELKEKTFEIYLEYNGGSIVLFQRKFKVTFDEATKLLKYAQRKYRRLERMNDK